MLSEVYIGLGSNLCDRMSNIESGLRLLEHIAENIAVSAIYETTPQGFRNQPSFFNAACRLWTNLDPFELLHGLKQIEAAVGRRRTFLNAPRTLDLDILIYGRIVLESPILTIPHPRMTQRAFVMAPLSELAPGLIHPVLKETVCSLCMRLSTSSHLVRSISLVPERGG